MRHTIQKTHTFITLFALCPFISIDAVQVGPDIAIRLPGPEAQHVKDSVMVGSSTDGFIDEVHICYRYNLFFVIDTIFRYFQNL